jgi:hypothetical protein
MRISKYITGTDRRARLDASFNMRYAAKYYVFAQILALYQARIITNPIRQLYSLSYCVYSCLIGFVNIWSQIRAMNLAKSLNGSKKKFQSNGSFLPKINLPAGLINLILKNKACCSILIKELNYRLYIVSEWVVLLITC